MNRAYYLWARDQIKSEAASGFSALKSLQTSLTWRFLHIMTSLSEPARIAVWKSLLKRFHLEGAKAAGDPMTNEDETAITQYQQTFDASYAVLCRPTVVGRLASNRDMQLAVSARLQDSLRVKPEKNGNKLLRFVSNYRKVVIHTYLDTGSTNYQLCYWHNVIGASGQIVRERCSVLEWLGISSQTYWDEVSAGEIEPITASIANAVTMFMEFCKNELDL